jgi:hypothetical protein
MMFDTIFLKKINPVKKNRAAFNPDDDDSVSFFNVYPEFILTWTKTMGFNSTIKMADNRHAKPDY